MQDEALLKVVALAEQIGHVFLVTASGEGVPHLAAAGEVALRPVGDAASWSPCTWFSQPEAAFFKENKNVQETAPV